MDGSSDPFRLRLRAASAGLTPHLRPHLLDYDRLRSHIKRIVFYQQTDSNAASSAPSTSPTHLTVPEQSSGRRSASQPAAAAEESERAKRHHELFWSELKRQVEVVNSAYSREEKDCRKLIAQLAVGGPDVAAACRLITAHCSSASASAPIRPPSAASRPVLAAFNELLALCASLSSLSHLLFLSYLVLWRTISKYNRHTASSVDQRLLAAFPSSPFQPPPRLAAVLASANQLFSASAPASAFPSSAPCCPLCLNPAAVSVRLSCHTACFHCSVRQPGFGVCCPVCKTEEEADADNLQLGDWVQRVGRLRVERQPEPQPQHRPELGTKREREEGQQEAAALHSKAEKHRKLMVKVSEANELALAVSVTPSPPFPSLPFPSSPLSARSYSSASSYVSTSSSLSLPLGPPVLPPSPGPNASPAAASAFDAFFASHYRPKRGQGVSCHQCKTNKEPSTLLFCANREEKGVRRRRCRKKYCESCLRRSYPLSVLVREEGRDWHCPSCVGVCCCAACQRKDTGSPAAGASIGSGEPDAAKLEESSPQLLSIGSDRDRQKAAAGDRPGTAARAAGDGQQSASHSLYRSHGRLSSSSLSCSPSLSFFGHPLPQLEPLSSPMTPDSVTLPLPLASPSLHESDAPSFDDWQQQQQQLSSAMQQTAGDSRKQSFTASHQQQHPGVRSLLPPNSLLAAINPAMASASSSQLYSQQYGGQELAGDREGSAALQAFFTTGEEETGRRSGSVSQQHHRQRSGRPSLSVSTSSARPQMPESSLSSYGYGEAVQGEAEDGRASRRGSRSAGVQSRHHRGSSFTGSLFATQPPSSLFPSQQAQPAFQSTGPLPSAAAPGFRSGHSHTGSLDFSSYAQPSVGSFLSLPSLTSSPTGGLGSQYAYPELSSAASSLISSFAEPAADYSGMLQHHADYAAKSGMDSDAGLANMDDLFAP